LFNNPVGCLTSLPKKHEFLDEIHVFLSFFSGSCSETEASEQLLCYFAKNIRKIIHGRVLGKIFYRHIIKTWRLFTESMIIDREILPEPMFSYIHFGKIKISGDIWKLIFTGVGHGIKDVIPYILWGNDPTDFRTTKFLERISGTYKGPIPKYLTP
jgi:hypothetical protein